MKLIFILGSLFLSSAFAYEKGFEPPEQTSVSRIIKDVKILSTGVVSGGSNGNVANDIGKTVQTQSNETELSVPAQIKQA